MERRCTAYRKALGFCSWLESAAAPGSKRERAGIVQAQRGAVRRYHMPELTGVPITRGSLPNPYKSVLDGLPPPTNIPAAS